MNVRGPLKEYGKRILARIPTSRIPTVSRITLDFELRRLFEKLESGVVLDVGSGNQSLYKSYIPHTKYMTLDINDTYNPDIRCDLHRIEWESDFFDTVIATEILEHLYDPQTAVNQIHRILRSGGICIASTRFLYRYHADPKDYYRFTWDSLRYLFRKFSEVEVIHLGNRIHVLWEMINIPQGAAGVILNVFNPLFARIRLTRTLYPSGFLVYAKK